MMCCQTTNLQLLQKLIFTTKFNLNSKIYYFYPFFFITSFAFSTIEKDTTTVNTDISSYNHLSDDEQRTSSTHVRIAFEDGFYMRWHNLMKNPIIDKFKDNTITANDSIYRYSHYTQSEENFDQFFNETFDNYRQMHPATSERVHRRYSYSSGDCIGLYDFLISNGEKHESTAKCLTNVTGFLVSKEKLFEIFNTYTLWDVVWLEIGMFRFCF